MIRGFFEESEAGCRTLLLVAMLSVAVTFECGAQDPLPFDTVGARRGNLPTGGPTPSVGPGIFRGFNPIHNFESLRFTSGAVIAGQAPRELRAWTVVKNTGRQVVRVGHGDCPLNIRLWRNAVRQGNPAWRSEFRAAPYVAGQQPSFYGCNLALRLRDLEPGDSLSFHLAVPIIEVLADSLPDGQYWPGVELRLVNDSIRERRSVTYAFPVGTLDVRRAPDPPPEMRQIGPLRFEAAARVVAGRLLELDSVRVFVLVTNTSSDTADLAVANGNPVAAILYRSAAARDAQPLGRGEYVIARTGVFANGVMKLAPGEKWLFDNATGVKELVRLRGAGDWYLTALLTGREPVILSAGAIRLTP